MLFSTVLMWLLIAAGIVVALPALWMLSRGLWPAMAQKHRDAAGKGVVLGFLMGLPPITAGIILVAVLSKVPKMGAVAVMVGGLFIAWGLAGAGGIATLVGERLWPDLTNTAPWRQTLRGGLVLILCTLLPVVGWFVLLPMLAIVGWGINVRSWFLKSHTEETVPALDAVSSPSA